MYQVYLEVAFGQKEYAAEISYRYTWQAEKTDAVFFKRAKDATESGNTTTRDPSSSAQFVVTQSNARRPITTPSARRRMRKSGYFKYILSDSTYQRSIAITFSPFYFSLWD